MKFLLPDIKQGYCLSPKKFHFEAIGCSLRPISTTNEQNLANFEIQSSRTCFELGLLNKMNICHETSLYEGTFSLKSHDRQPEFQGSNFHFNQTGSTTFSLPFWIKSPYLGNHWSDLAEILTVNLFLDYITTSRVRSKL